VIYLTVGSKLHKTLASLRSAKADMETFAMETKDQNAQQLFSSTAKQLENAVNSISQRTNSIEQQEPQYKEKQNLQGQSTMQSSTNLQNSTMGNAGARNAQGTKGKNKKRK